MNEPAAAIDGRTLIGLAVDLAEEAGALVAKMAATARSSPTTKSSSSDLVTEADQAAEQLIVDGLLAARPNDAIEGEEGASLPGTSPVTWHIDPIDGTTNYVYAIPAFSISIAAEVDGAMRCGVVLNPTTGERYEAVAGGGATCNGEPLRARRSDVLATSLIATGFGYNAERRRRQAEILVELLPTVRDIRRFGSAALDLCAVATGQVDAYYERGLNRWDLAAGALIAAEAGAVVADLRDGPPGPEFLLAAGPELFAELAPLLRRLEADSGP